MDLKKYIYSHCVFPVKTKIFDAYSQSYKFQYVPCGKCLHCKNTAVNEWVTRLYAQALYSNYVYYITLDYAPFSYEKDTFSDSTAAFLAAETAAVWQNYNKYHRYGMQPLLLKKNHLQDFLKRFRKNIGLKIQYFACGEYGTHAEGSGYGRPHFHLIVFSESPISQMDFQSAWTLNGYKIGNVKYEDITLEAKGYNIPTINNNAKACFKYVCKYLKKQDFDFESLRTINYHRAYFKSLQYEFAKVDTLFPERVPITDSETLKYNWIQYIKDFSPFVVCSKRPAIGLQYLQDNIERFKTRDFRLFGLPAEDLLFPRYYVRKTKESFTSLVAVGLISQKPTTNSSLGFVSSVLDQISSSRLDFSSFGYSFEESWRVYSNKYLKPYFDCDGSIDISSLHLYDTNTHVFYQFNGYYYTLWQKVKNLGFHRLDIMDIREVSNMIRLQFNNLYNLWIKPMYDHKSLCESELYDTINQLYSGDTTFDKYDNFVKDVYSYYQIELDSIRKTTLLTNNSKIEF